MEESEGKKGREGGREEKSMINTYIQAYKNTKIRNQSIYA